MSKIIHIDKYRVLPVIAISDEDICSIFFGCFNIVVDIEHGDERGIQCRMAATESSSSVEATSVLCWTAIFGGRIFDTAGSILATFVDVYSEQKEISEDCQGV